MPEFIDQAISFLRSHGQAACLAWTAALLVVYGDKLGRFFKNIAKGWHFATRLTFFVFVCGFGYGFVTIYVGNLIHRYLSRLHDTSYLAILLVAFIVLGSLAEKKRQI